MRWKYLIEEFFENNDEGTIEDVKIWVENNKFDLFCDDVEKWIRRICMEDPKLKQFWYPLSNERTEKLALQKIRQGSGAVIRQNLNKLVSNGILKKTPCCIGFQHFKYIKLVKESRAWPKKTN